MEFRRIPGLPPYVFTIIDGLKIEARRAGRDVVDLGFGNPDLPSPQVAVDKLAEAAQNSRNHRYSASRGIPKLRRPSRAVPAPVRREPRPGHRDHLDHRRQGGLQPPHVGAAAAGRRRARPHPELPDPHLGPLLRGRRRAPGPHRRRDRRAGYIDRIIEAWELGWPKPRVVVLSFPHNPTTTVATKEDLQRSSTGRGTRTSCSCTTSRTPT
nr:hypothetical protein [Cellulosimicrobium sp. MM]